MLRDHDEQASGNREPANEMFQEDPMKGIPFWLQPFTINLEDPEAYVLWQVLQRIIEELQNELYVE